MGIQGLLQTTIFGYPVGKAGEFWANFQSWLVAIAVVILGASEYLQARRGRATSALGPLQGRWAADHGRDERLVLLVCIVVPLAAWMTALLLSARLDVLIPRCLATLAPLLILALSYWLARSGPVDSVSVPNVALAFLLVTYFATIYAITRSTRSNAKEVAAAVSASTQQNDLLIVAPEWLASSFNRYYLPQVEQVDFPHFGREGAVDFVGIHERIADTRALEHLTQVIARATAQRPPGLAHHGVTKCQ